MLTQRIGVLIVIYVGVLLTGFLGMGLWRAGETAWNDHAQIEENRNQVEAVINYLNQQGQAFQQFLNQQQQPEEPADPTP